MLKLMNLFVNQSILSNQNIKFSNIIAFKIPNLITNMG